MAHAALQVDADYYAKRGEAPPWFVEACERHREDLHRYHEYGHGEIAMRPAWARTGAKHGTTKETRPLPRKESTTQRG